MSINLKQSNYLDYVTVLVLIGAMPANELPPLVPSFELPDPEPTGLSPLRAAYTEEITRWNAGDMTAYARGFHEDAVIKYAPFGMVPMSREQHIAIQELYLLAFPDRYMDVIRRVDLGDGWVLTEVMFEATNTGPFFGLPATGQPVHFKGAWIGRFDADGLRTEISYYYDSLTMLTQLGLVPAP